jgi:hypothetical protein
MERKSFAIMKPRYPVVCEGGSISIQQEMNRYCSLREGKEWRPMIDLSLSVLPFKLFLQA